MTTLFAFALFLRFLAPAGYMVDAKAPSHGLVICTGHGPLTLGAPDRSKDRGHRSADMPCAFAGAVTPVTPPLFVAITQPAAISIETTASPLPRDLAPGRGFAAPPPPSRGPPLV